jgi:hypothetical protein
MHECSVLHLLDLQPEKVLQLAHHAHLEFPKLGLAINKICKNEKVKTNLRKLGLDKLD